jgi:hypothetical protein
MQGAQEQMLGGSMLAGRMQGSAGFSGLQIPEEPMRT